MLLRNSLVAEVDDLLSLQKTGQLLTKGLNRFVLKLFLVTLLYILLLIAFLFQLQHGIDDQNDFANLDNLVSLRHFQVLDVELLSVGVLRKWEIPKHIQIWISFQLRGKKRVWELMDQNEVKIAELDPLLLVLKVIIKAEANSIDWMLFHSCKIEVSA